MIHPNIKTLPDLPFHVAERFPDRVVLRPPRQVVEHIDERVTGHRCTNEKHPLTFLTVKAYERASRACHPSASPIRPPMSAPVPAATTTVPKGCRLT